MPDRDVDTHKALVALDELSDAELHDIIHRMREDPRAQRKTGIAGWWRRWSGSAAFITLIIALSVGFFVNEERVRENRAVACATADLIAFVPAVQFEGESLENFIGWLDARRDVLHAAREAQTCEPRIIEALESRIEEDDRLLEQIGQPQQ